MFCYMHDVITCKRLKRFFFFFKYGNTNRTGANFQHRWLPFSTGQMIMIKVDWRFIVGFVLGLIPFCVCEYAYISLTVGAFVVGQIFLPYKGVWLKGGIIYSHDQIIVSLTMVVGLGDLQLYSCNWRDYSSLKKFPMYLTTEWLLLLHPFRPISVLCCTFLFFFFQICNQVNPCNFISSGACLE